MTRDVVGLITGTGLRELSILQEHSSQQVTTSYGKPSSVLTSGVVADTPVAVIQRHGSTHTIPPHCINYRANISALSNAGVRHIISIAAVGGIRADCIPGILVVPDQIIDYTSGREHTFSDGISNPLTYCDMTAPFCEELRQTLISVARKNGNGLVDNGCYAVTQGPRLETAAEIQRLKQDGNDMVGMTVMPEAALAAEHGMCYAVLAVVVNWAAGLGADTVSDQLDAVPYETTSLLINQILLNVIPSLPGLGYQGARRISI